MSPEIEIDGQLVADVPDETGLHQMLDGSPLHVDVSGIEATNSRQVIILEGPAIGGRRVVGLTQEGKGNSNNSKKGGDGEHPTLKVTLRDRPIRVSYNQRVEVDSVSLAPPRESRIIWRRITHHNPRWAKK